MAESPEGFNHVGLPVNWPPGPAGLPFNESSEIEFRHLMEPMPSRHKLPTADSITFRTRDDTAVFVLRLVVCRFRRETSNVSLQRNRRSLEISNANLRRDVSTVKQPTAYLDTNIISAYWYGGRDASGLARRQKTREWWNDEREYFSVWASTASEDELAAGKFPRQAECLRFVRKLRYLPIDQETRQVAAKLVALGVVPGEKPGDALQMSVCVVHGIDYLLSWNYAHLVNPVAQQHLEEVCRKLSRRAPLLVSPESIPKVCLGQVIRRRES